MRKLTASLFISVDGVVESPDKYIRPELYQYFDPFIDDGIADQDGVLLGRKTYNEWAPFWPTSDIQPFADFINQTPKYVLSSTLTSLGWDKSTLLSGDMRESLMALKNQPGKSIGVHGSISVVQSLLLAGLLDELRLLLIPAIAGKGRRLFTHEGDAIQLELQSAQALPEGLQYLVYRR